MKKFLLLLVPILIFVACADKESEPEEKVSLSNRKYASFPSENDNHYHKCVYSFVDDKNYIKIYEFEVNNNENYFKIEERGSYTFSYPHLSFNCHSVLDSRSDTTFVEVDYSYKGTFDNGYMSFNSDSLHYLQYITSED